eukprot:1151070-Pelagomonas_calceolata.AAC.2
MVRFIVMSSDSATNATVSESSSLFGDWRPNLSLYFVCILKNGREGIFGSGCRSCGCNRSMLSFPPGLTRKYMKRISAGTCAWNPSFCHAIRLPGCVACAPQVPGVLRKSKGRYDGSKFISKVRSGSEEFGIGVCFVCLSQTYISDIGTMLKRKGKERTVYASE